MGSCTWCQYFRSLGLLHQRASSTLHSFVGWYWLASASDPHAADMGRVESEQAVVCYSSDSSQHCLRFLSRHFGPIWQIHHMYVGFTFRSWLSWLIYFTVVGAPPYPGFNGCLMTSANQDIGFLWAILLIWDTRKCEYAIQCHCSSDWKGSVANAHVGTCHPFLWEIPVLTWFWWLVQCILIFSISDRARANGTLVKTVYSDGKPLGSSWCQTR